MWPPGQDKVLSAAATSSLEHLKRNFFPNGFPLGCKDPQAHEETSAWHGKGVSSTKATTDLSVQPSLAVDGHSNVLLPEITSNTC